MTKLQQPRREFLSAEWRDLVMLNYAVSPDLLRPLVPAGTELDAWQGTTYVSVVGFRFLNTRVFGASFPGHRNFEEVNLRFYVRRDTPEGPRRGVVFIRELVPRLAIAWVARVRYNEPYRVRRMRHEIDRSLDGGRIAARYEWSLSTLLGMWGGVALETDARPAPLVAGSEEEFITEHYWGYTRQRDGSTIEYRVDHPRWQVAPGRTGELTTDTKSLHGAEFAEALTGSLKSAFYAEGSAVTVYRPIRL